MYFDSKVDFQIIWQFAHNWVDAGSGKSDSKVLSKRFKEATHSRFLCRYLFSALLKEV